MKSEERVSVTDPPAGTGGDDFTFAFPPQAGYVAMARIFAGAVARHFGCNDDVIDDVKVAISETVTNAVKAHGATGSDDHVQLVIQLIDDHLTFNVIDKGPGFDFSPTMPETTELAVLSRGSLGLALVRSLFPATDVRRNSDKGMTVAFTLDLVAARQNADA
jgi:serine/threonine-protein kinase RsbW